MKKKLKITYSKTVLEQIRNQQSAYAKTKTQISFVVTAKLLSTLVCNLPLLKSEISSFQPASVTAQPDLCWTYRKPLRYGSHVVQLETKACVEPRDLKTFLCMPTKATVETSHALKCQVSSHII